MSAEWTQERHEAARALYVNATACVSYIAPIDEKYPRYTILANEAFWDEDDGHAVNSIRDIGEIDSEDDAKFLEDGPEMLATALDEIERLGDVVESYQLGISALAEDRERLEHCLTVTDEMVERAARAMYAAMPRREDTWYAPWARDEEKNVGLSEATKDEYRDKARAALEAALGVKA